MRIKYPYFKATVDCGHGDQCHPPCPGVEIVNELNVRELKKRYRDVLIALAWCLINGSFGEKNQEGVRKCESVLDKGRGKTTGNNMKTSELKELARQYFQSQKNGCFDAEDSREFDRICNLLNKHGYKIRITRGINRFQDKLIIAKTP